VDLWEAMSTARSIRRFTTDPVDDALLGRCLEAATWAPSGGNQQPWRFVVLRSEPAREIVGAAAAATAAVAEQMYRIERPSPDDNSPRARNARAMFELHDTARDVPAAVLFCVKEQPRTPELLLGASIYPAMQNFLLAVRAVGLGACLTGWHLATQDRYRDVIGIPPDWQLAALVAVGWPASKHGPVRRRPVSEVAVLDRWDEPFLATPG
jgi:nitroreductase